MVQRYRSRLSGPLLDRIDLHIEVPRVPHKDLTGTAPVENSASIRQRVNAARHIPAILIMENHGRNNLLDKSPPFCYNSMGEVSTT